MRRKTHKRKRSVKPQVVLTYGHIERRGERGRETVTEGPPDRHAITLALEEEIAQQAVKSGDEWASVELWDSVTISERRQQHIVQCGWLWEHTHTRRTHHIGGAATNRPSIPSDGPIDCQLFAIINRCWQRRRMADNDRSSIHTHARFDFDSTADSTAYQRLLRSQWSHVTPAAVTLTYLCI